MKMKILKSTLRKIIKEEIEAEKLLQERIHPVRGDRSAQDIMKVVTRGPGSSGLGIERITPQSARGLGRHWEPWRGFGRFRYIDPGEIQDKLQLIEKKANDAWLEQFVSSAMVEKVEKGKEQADASDEGRGVAKLNYWMDFVDSLDGNEERLGRFVSNPDEGESNDYIVMGSWRGPEGTRFADQIFIVFKTLGPIYFVDRSKGFLKEKPHYYLAIAEE